MLFALLGGLALGGCVIDQKHVRTELVKICTEDIPLGFARESATLAASELPIGDIGDQVDDNPGARAELESVIFAANGDFEDFAFADAVRVLLVVPSAPEPEIAIADDDALTGESPLVAAGDRSINLVEYLVRDEVSVRFEITGAIPAPSFSTLFSACLDVEGVAVGDIDE